MAKDRKMNMLGLGAVTRPTQEGIHFGLINVGGTFREILCRQHANSDGRPFLLNYLQTPLHNPYSNWDAPNCPNLHRIL